MNNNTGKSPVWVQVNNSSSSFPIIVNTSDPRSKAYEMLNSVPFELGQFSPDSYLLSPVDFEQLKKAIVSPREPNDELKKLFNLHNKK